MTTPYYSDGSVTLYLGDWRELIAPDFRADLILTDPPYGETNLEWDRWPEGWPALAARHANAMWCWGSMRMFLDRRDEFASRPLPTADDVAACSDVDTLRAMWLVASPEVRDLISARKAELEAADQPLIPGASS